MEDAWSLKSAGAVRGGKKRKRKCFGWFFSMLLFFQLDVGFPSSVLT
jgi:hypothetical protein